MPATPFPARDAVGLMQLMPKTGAKLARKLRLGFSRARLFDPEYNLAARYALSVRSVSRLWDAGGGAGGLQRRGGSRGAVDAGQNYEETAEFVESIPFTETREYVQIVLRNAELYRNIYGRAHGRRSRSAVAPTRAPLNRAVCSARLLK